MKYLLFVLLLISCGQQNVKEEALKDPYIESIELFTKLIELKKSYLLKEITESDYNKQKKEVSAKRRILLKDLSDEEKRDIKEKELQLTKAYLDSQ